MLPRVLLIGLLFDGSPWLAGFAFAGCYLLGAAAALISAWIARRTILPGRSRPMVLELPAYRRPSIRNAILVSWDRGMVFLKNAGTIILGIVIVMWWLSAYPKAESPDAAIALRTEAAEVMTADPVHSEELEAQAERIELNAQQSESMQDKKISWYASICINLPRGQ